MKKLLFKATLREIDYLLENNYLNKKGKKWANDFIKKDDEVEE